MRPSPTFYLADVNGLGLRSGYTPRDVGDDLKTCGSPVPEPDQTWVSSSPVPSLDIVCGQGLPQDHCSCPNDGDAPEEEFFPAAA